MNYPKNYIMLNKLTSEVVEATNIEENFIAFVSNALSI